MIIYLLKSAACLCIFLLFYKILLEKESMHHFKRYFLLTAVIASLTIPQIVFTEYVEIEPTTVATKIISINEPQDIEPVVKAIEKSPINWSLILWNIYGLGVAGFSLRFLMNLYKIWKRIHNNPKTKHSAIYRILLKEQLPPHTFLRYIFLNKQKFETNGIPNSVLLHEETHAVQWHSLDVLFLEVLQVLFWFNPLIYAFKKTIRLNHEFLADSAVLNGQEDHLNYQNTLLSYVSNDSFNTHQSVGMANAINYSSIKKRFIIMKKKTSKKSFLLRTLLLLPLLVLMLYGFSIKETIEKTIDTNNRNKEIKVPNELIEISVNKEQQIMLNNQIVPLHLLAEKISQSLTPLENINISEKDISLRYEGKLNMDFLDSIKKEIEKSGAFIKQIVADTIVIKDEDNWKENYKGLEIVAKSSFIIHRKNGKTITGISSDRGSSEDEAPSFHKSPAKKYQEIIVKKIVVNINKNGQLLIKGELVKLKNLQEYLSKINSQLSTTDKKKIMKAIIRTTPESPKEVVIKVKQELTKYGTATIDIQEYNPKTSKVKLIATTTQISKYNELAKKYNFMISNGGSIRIKKSHVDQLTFIYRIMSKEQKAAAEPFPDFPEPPPIPKAPNTADYVDAAIERIIATQDTYDGALLQHKANNLLHYNTAYINTDEELKYEGTISDIEQITNDVKELELIKKTIKSDLNFRAPQGAPKGPEMPKTSSYSNKLKREIIRQEENLSIDRNLEKKDSNIPPPPSPPTPPSPLDYAIDMAKKGATFFYEGKKVSSDKAIDLLKKNKELNIESKKKNGKAEVRITKEPVTIR